MSDTLTNALGIASLLLLWGFVGHLDAEDEAALAEATRAANAVPREQALQDPPQRPLRLLCLPEAASTSPLRAPAADSPRGLRLASLQADVHPASGAGTALRCLIDND